MSGKWKQPENYVELTNDMVLNIAKEELHKLQSSFENLKNNVKNVQKNNDKLDKINNLIQESKLNQVDKEQFIKTLNNLKKNIESSNKENINAENLKNEYDKVTGLLDSLIQKELNNLKNDIQNSRTSNHKNWNQWPPIRPKEVEEGIENSSENIPRLIEDAKNDKSWFIRNVIAKLLERANS